MPGGRLHGSGGDWSTPRRSSESKKKLRLCWVSRWRRQTATTSHDGCSCCPGADTRSDRQGLRGSERVARQRLPSAHSAGPAVGHALFQTEPTACADRRGTTYRARPSARAALCRSGTRRSIRQPARRGRLPLLDPHHVPHPGRKPRSPRSPRSPAPSGLQKAGAAGASTQRGLVVGHHEADGAGQMDVLLPLRHHRCRPARDGALFCITTRRTLPLWICSWSRPLASNCFMRSSVRLNRRDLVWINVTTNPNAEWVARQITEAFPWNEAPRYMIRDRDRIYGTVVTRRLRAMGIRDKP